MSTFLDPLSQIVNQYYQRNLEHAQKAYERYQYEQTPEYKEARQTAQQQLDLNKLNILKTQHEFDVQPERERMAKETHESEMETQRSIRGLNKLQGDLTQLNINYQKDQAEGRKSAQVYYSDPKNQEALLNALPSSMRPYIRGVLTSKNPDEIHKTVGALNSLIYQGELQRVAHLTGLANDIYQNQLRAIKDKIQPLQFDLNRIKGELDTKTVDLVSSAKRIFPDEPPDAETLKDIVWQIYDNYWSPDEKKISITTVDRKALIDKYGNIAEKLLDEFPSVIKGHERVIELLDERKYRESDLREYEGMVPDQAKILNETIDMWNRVRSVEGVGVNTGETENGTGEEGDYSRSGTFLQGNQYPFNNSVLQKVPLPTGVVPKQSSGLNLENIDPEIQQQLFDAFDKFQENDVPMWDPERARALHNFRQYGMIR